MSKLSVGQRVKNRPELAHIYEGTGWDVKLALPREGTVVELPWFYRFEGHGTILIEWDSLTGKKADPKDWQIWMMAENVVPA